MTKKLKQPEMFGMRPTPEDRKLVAALEKKLGLVFPSLVRLALRRLAEKEGIAA